MERLSEGLAIVSTIDPVSTSTAVNGDVIDMKLYDRVIFIVATGVMATNATVDFLINGDVASGGSYATAITGKAITQLTKAGSDDAKQVIVEVTADEVAAQGLRYIRPTLTAATAASLVAMIALAGGLSYSPASGYDLASVDEIVAG